ncbi:MAG TPA: hypothetical protein VF510_20790 [Ktedonobacterales bacterium]
MDAFTPACGNALRSNAVEIRAQPLVADRTQAAVYAWREGIVCRG